MEKAKVVYMTPPSDILAQRNEPVLAQAPAYFDIIRLPPSVSEEEYIRQVRDADFILTNTPGITDRVLREARQLKLIQAMGTGVDVIPVKTCIELGIPVANAGGANAIGVAEGTVLLMLAVLHRLPPTIDNIRQGKWRVGLPALDYHEFYGKTVGIIGFGNIGRWVAKMLRGFETQTVFYDKVDIPEAIAEECYAKPVTLEQLLRTSDIVTLHVLLLESTRGIIGVKEIAMMKPSAIFINTARGKLVDEAALIKALQEKRIAGAGLDVFEEEPIDPASPLLRMDNVVVTPHFVGWAAETLDRTTHNIWDNLIRVWQGKTPNWVIREP